MCFSTAITPQVFCYYVLCVIIIIIILSVEHTGGGRGPRTKPPGPRSLAQPSPPRISSVCVFARAFRILTVC